MERRKRVRLRLILYVGVPLLVLLAGVLYMIPMPGKSYRGELPPLTAEEQALADYQFGGGALRGDPPPTYKLDAMGERGPSVHAALWKPLRDLALDDPEMKRAYARLPKTG